MARNSTVGQARALRRNAPLTERQLWKLLRGRRLADLKFRRQVPLGSYVVDFLCLRHRLVIEADGPFHDPALDAARDAWLRSQGFKVLRFTNEEITRHPERLIDAILDAVG